ncbi:hypothetical protein J7E99_26030 [Streptomyces sp. ISL-44]|uniref:hypothetical protein n=1 Tax=Streptomyces sp. ISL-44 TaxID=2819184 RepID=UPI001BE954AB|nr:hypothetical protein [Streptomyces sp. ISL-44]MBT2544068.1 hypothetical protein [Streptomyces sp. ISL-44]
MAASDIPCARDVLSIETEEPPFVRVAVVVGPGADLLDRALVGWERFLGTFDGASDE